MTLKHNFVKIMLGIHHLNSFRLLFIIIHMRQTLAVIVVSFYFKQQQTSASNDQVAPYSHFNDRHSCFFIGAVNTLQSADRPEEVYVFSHGSLAHMTACDCREKKKEVNFGRRVNFSRVKTFGKMNLFVCFSSSEVLKGIRLTSSMPQNSVCVCV